MAGKYSWIVLFVTLQISVVLCRSTEKPKEEDNVIHEGPILFPHGQASVVKSVDQFFADNLGEPTPESPSEKPQVEGISGVKGITYDSYRIATLAGILCALVVGIVCIISLIVVCIVFCCCQKEARPPAHTARLQQPGTTTPGNIQSMQRYPSPYGQT